jgi:pyridoxine 4-dehydrogenase
MKMLSLLFGQIIVIASLACGTTSVEGLVETLFGKNSSPTKISDVGRVSAGPNGFEISSMGVGTWSWGNRFLFDYDTSQDESIYEAYREVRNAGVTLFDTADSYGTLDLNGRAEILLGTFERRYLNELGIKSMNDNSNNDDEYSDDNLLSATTTTTSTPWWDLIGRGKDVAGTSSQMNNKNYRPQQVATKIAPYPWRITPKSVVRSAEGSLRRLEQNKLSVAQLHWSTVNYQPFQERALWEGICDVYDKGLCEAVGVSNYGPKQLFAVSEKFREREVPLAVAQVQYSLMTYNANTNSGNGKDMNEACDDVNCRLISYSPLCLGLLTGKYTLKETNRLPTSPARQQLFKELLPGAQGLLDTLEVVAKEYGKSQSQIAINWCMRKGTVPIPGSRTLTQARENLGATGWSLRPDAVRELENAASKVTKPMVQNVFQTE